MAEIINQTLTTHPEYDVFLSFRGPDTRRAFISFLHKELVRKNIKTFKDDKDLRPGRRILPQLKNAIKNSKFAVVVVSKNYAASTWCLDELVDIMDFENKGSLTVMPIFYGVDPCHVRRQTGEVAEQFTIHEGREVHEKVLAWRHALTDLASISGDCSLKWEDDSKLVDEITERISKELINATISNGRLLVLNSNKSVRIWGRGGNSRSALDTFVYHKICQCFESHCFLKNVKINKVKDQRRVSLCEQAQNDSAIQRTSMQEEWRPKPNQEKKPIDNTLPLQQNKEEDKSKGYAEKAVKDERAGKSRSPNPNTKPF